MEVRNVEELQAFASDLAAKLLPDASTATVVALSGDLGAGKTTFAQALARALGVTEDVTSPTFVIEKAYALTGQAFERLIHIDAYRLDSPHELEVLGFQAMAGDPKNLIVLEWPERVPGLIPENATRIRFDIHGDERTISINGNSAQG